MVPCPIDLRERVLRAVGGGEGTREEIARASGPHPGGSVSPWAGGPRPARSPPSATAVAASS
jgi:hypothetical protein